jgi:hypothetical protein
MKKLIYVFFCFLGSVSAYNAQMNSSFIDGEITSGIRKKPKNSMAKGTGFVYWGYNRSAYTRSTINFTGAGYDFSLKGVKATDRPSTKISEYLNPTTFTVPQFNFRAGYNFKNYWNISVGYDHLKYVMVHGPEYLLNGRINGGIDPNWSGNLSNKPVVTNEADFHYENSNGLNYIRAELTKVRNITRNRRDNFTLSYLLGVSSGALLSFNDFTFGGKKDVGTVSLSGIGVSGHAGMRFEFFKYVFLQTNVAAGLMRQINVRTRANEYSAIARQNFGYLEGSVVLGALFYIRPTNSCDSCPAWD